MEHPYTVVVGVSATSRSPAALAWADAQVRQRGGRLIALRAWRMPNPQATPAGTPASRISREDDVEREQRAALEADVAATSVPTTMRRSDSSAVAGSPPCWTPAGRRTCSWSTPPGSCWRARCSRTG
jgi:hypothetical protein